MLSVVAESPVSFQMLFGFVASSACHPAPTNSKLSPQLSLCLTSREVSCERDKTAFGLWKVNSSRTQRGRYQSSARSECRV